tara:strand:- start:5293 stop:5769 length:477 start_codon:yes stop_codon:yes gene_type:complete
MPTGTIDILEHQIRTGTGTNQVDTDIQRISVSTYAKISSKNTRGKPSQVFVQRLATSTTLTLWPVPDEADTYTLAHFYLLGTDGISSGLSGSAAVPPRFVPCLVAGLAYYIAMKKPEVANRVAPLKQEYEFQFELAANEDTDSSAIKFVPYDTFFLGG